jgi:hypothetical protein
MQDKDLDDLFAAARDVPVVSDGVMARVLADAQLHQPRAMVVPAQGPTQGPSQSQSQSQSQTLWRRILAAIGGGPALAGLSAAALAGVWIGFAQPGQVSDLLLVGNTTTETLDVFPAFDDFVIEG